MKQNKLRVLISVMMAFMLFVMNPTIVNAKKIIYGKFCAYEGKVDSDESPSGEGKLYFFRTDYHNKRIGDLDVIKGIFDGNTVTNASIVFDDSNFLNQSKFFGSLEYTLNSNGDGITYKLIEGILHTEKGNFECCADDPCIITRWIKSGFDQTFVTGATGSLLKRETLQKESFTAPIKIEDIGQFKSLSTIYNWKNGYHSDYWLESTGKKLMMFENGIKVIDGKNIEYPNGDFFRHDGTSLIELNKNYSNGVAILLSKGVIAYTINNKAGVVLFNNKVEDLFNILMSANEFPVSKFSKNYTGEIAKFFVGAAKDDANCQYKLGMAYMEGNGVDKDEVLGREWLEKAVKNGNESAKSAIAKIELKKEKQKLDTYKQNAIRNSDELLMYEIASGYEKGGMQRLGVAVYCNFVQNIDSAIVWYKKSAAINSNYQKYVVAAEYKKKTGGDYWLYKEQQEEKEAYEKLCKQFGKQYVDAVVRRQVIVGMPEKLLLASFDAKLYGQSGNTKTYRIYGWGSRIKLDGTEYISNDHHLMTVWVSGGKVTSFQKWE